MNLNSGKANQGAKLHETVWIVFMMPSFETLLNIQVAKDKLEPK